MITPAAAPPIVRSGHRRPGGCRSDHPQYQYGSKPIYCGHRIFPTTPTAEIRSPRHCWRQRQCIGTTVLPLATTTRVAMGPGSIRWPSGMSVAALDNRRRSDGCCHRGGRLFVFVVRALITNHKPRASNDTDHRQQATGHQTANMCGGGKHILWAYEGVKCMF